ncbi:BTAD domain-containing putative transcriptional regulator [Dactylosporangium sp. NPDC000244]|uniref:BTAD domain-containing putative transcriptional regulator n=1 Tax=Dactylosporangium sp. NPDC000244 TaxID=3154365 RepID=UPI00332329DF
MTDNTTVDVDPDVLTRQAAAGLDTASALQHAATSLGAATTTWSDPSVLPSLRVAAAWAHGWGQHLDLTAAQIQAWAAATRTAAAGYRLADDAAVRMLSQQGGGTDDAPPAPGTAETVPAVATPAAVPEAGAAGPLSLAEALTGPFARFQSGADVAAIGATLTDLATDTRALAAGLEWHGSAAHAAVTAVDGLTTRIAAAAEPLTTGGSACAAHAAAQLHDRSLLADLLTLPDAADTTAQHDRQALLARMRAAEQRLITLLVGLWPPTSGNAASIIPPGPTGGGWAATAAPATAAVTDPPGSTGTWRHLERWPDTLDVPWHDAAGMQDVALAAAPPDEGDAEQQIVLGGSAPAAPAQTYVVRDGDTLSGIARQHLGDSQRWPELYALNRGTPQPDGLRLTDPDLLEPGWRLRLPDTTPDRQPLTPGPTDLDQPPQTSHTTPQTAAPPAAAPTTVQTPVDPSADDPALPAWLSHSLVAAGAATLGAAATAAVLLHATQPREQPASTSLPAPGTSPHPGPPAAAHTHPQPVIAAPDAPQRPVASDHRRSPSRSISHTGGADQSTSEPNDAPDGRSDLRPEPPANVHTEVSTTTALHTLEPNTARPHGAEPTPPVTCHSTAQHPATTTGWERAGLGLIGPGAHAVARAVLITATAAASLDGAAQRTLIAAADLGMLLGSSADTKPPALTGVEIAHDHATLLTTAEEALLQRARTTTTTEPIPDDRDGPLHPGEHSELDQDQLAAICGAAGAAPLVLLSATPHAADHARWAALLIQGRPLGIRAVFLGPWTVGTTIHITAAGAITHTDGDPHELTAWLDAHTNLLPIATAEHVLTQLATATRSGTTTTDDETTGQHDELAEAAASDTRPSTIRTRHDPIDAGAPVDLHALAALAPETSVIPAPASATAPSSPAIDDAEAGPPHQDEAASASAAGTADTPLAPIRVTVLGTPRIADGPPPKEPLRAKALELLVYLIARGGAASQDAIIEDLLPDAPFSKAGHRLHTYVSNLRRVLTHLTPPEHRRTYIDLVAKRYGLNRDAFDVDLWNMHDALTDAATATDPVVRTAALHRAVDAYTGSLADTTTYEWAEPYREDIRRQAASAAATLADALRNQPAEALTVLGTALRHHPHDEALYRAAMRHHAALGDTTAIRTLHHTLTERLHDVDATPSQQTNALVQQLLAQPGPDGGIRPPRKEAA